MRRRLFKIKKTDSSYLLQLTSMIDMFTILLVFLLKSYATSPVVFTPEKDLKLPVSTSQKNADDALKLVVSAEGIFIENKKIIDLQNGIVNEASVDTNDHNFIRPLYDTLDQFWTAREAAQSDETKNKLAQVIMQADSSLPYITLKKVMYTASMAGYTNLKLATIAKE